LGGLRKGGVGYQKTTDTVHRFFRGPKKNKHTKNVNKWFRDNWLPLSRQLRPASSGSLAGTFLSFAEAGPKRDNFVIALWLVV